MSDDIVDQMFGDLSSSPKTAGMRESAFKKEAAEILTGEEKDYPGKKAPVNRPDSEPQEDADEVWSESPIVYIHNGVAREFYTIGHLSRALGRQPVTIRSWENKGVLPRSKFRSPPPSHSPIQGSNRKGKRLWTKEQIQAILDAAAEAGCITDKDKSAPNQKFTHLVREKFHSLSNK